MWSKPVRAVLLVLCVSQPPAPCYAGRSEHSTHGHIHTSSRNHGSAGNNRGGGGGGGEVWMGLGTHGASTINTGPPPTHQKREQGQQCHHRVGALNNPGICAPCLVIRKFGFVFVFVCVTQTRAQYGLLWVRQHTVRQQPRQIVPASPMEEIPHGRTYVRGRSPRHCPLRRSRVFANF